MNSDFEDYLRRQPLREIPPSWRARVLAHAKPSPGRWREWLFPAPRAWAALGAAWIVIFCLYLATPKGPPPGVGPAPSFASLQEQARMMAQLLRNDEPPAVPPAPPKPRTERERRPLFG